MAGPPAPGCRCRRGGATARCCPQTGGQQVTCSSVQRNAVQSSAAQRSVAQHSTAQHSAVQCSAVQSLHATAALIGCYHQLCTETDENRILAISPAVSFKSKSFLHAPVGGGPTEDYFQVSLKQGRDSKVPLKGGLTWIRAPDSGGRGRGH
jgi:hypothetical protein